MLSGTDVPLSICMSAQQQILYGPALGSVLPILVGMGATKVELPIPVIQNNEIWLTGIFRYNNTWPTAIGLVERGIVDLDGLCTHHFGLAQVGDALNSTTKPGVIKSVVNPYL